MTWIGRLCERDLEKVIGDYLAWRRWQVRKTDVYQAARGKRIGETGQADSICLRPTGKLGVAEVFFAEFKRPLARTNPNRLAKQAQWAERIRAQGFLVYRCPEACADPYEDFRAWYRLHVDEEER